MTSNRTKPPEMECRFCRIGAGRAHLSHDRVLMDSDDYFAIASIGGFIEGWTLVCAKRHTLNFSDDYGRSALREFVSEVASVVSSVYGPIVAFEHGVRRNGSLTGCGTDHAHLHLVPLRESLVQRVCAYDRARAWVRGPSSDVGHLTGSHEYLLMADSVEALWTSAYVSNVSEPQSQFFRKVLAAQHGFDGQSDYRSFPFAETTARTSKRLGEIACERFPSAVA
ncbi:diadenosine tetraphosphate (Ap4A) HIT family hydrolase [Paraburkholderia bannensis]|uniref:Diadenosine tetraphosphate (Ap4A) HIT family hydrolase n=1 Tax=Paraburkholderia bannensis TaxID=765414 RepID=A0A7W9U1N0_9BURK|nr:MULTISPECIES: HIT domain-containing protein [Paraburkholderia]MBB3260370.1 diadenosine tetraphosphate (Ap4A) HIT family hydrolase [Paraburkholderia sp. WP4_3_2]MBB6105406.1 diadenosine tetraphosphate (Ap4A) HIT family hydrolase [Paraburkholderia bannensis]